MKISDIVKINIENSLPYQSNASQMNEVGAIVYVGTDGGEDTTDSTWVDSESLGTGFTGETNISRAVTTFDSNGGVALVVKRIYFAGTETAAEQVDEITKAVYGGEGVLEIAHTALSSSIKNIQLVFDTAPSFTYNSLASELVDNEAPENTKILFVTSTVKPTGLTQSPNIFFHYISASASTNYFESIAAMAYLSQINYGLDQIKDYEYTQWAGNVNQVNILDSIDSTTIESGGKVNYFTTVAGLNVLIGGRLTNNVRLTSYYFELILGDRISDLLARITLQKLKFNQGTYSYLYNSITVELDRFANNGLLNTAYVSEEDKVVFRDGVRHVLVKNEERLALGYIVKTLPPTANDLSTKNYTGIYILYAIADQIRTLDVSGIVLGGIS